MSEPEKSSESELRWLEQRSISPSKPAASVAANAGAKTLRPQHVKLGNISHSGKPALALMSLRTIEFPDGRRITRLIPYHGGGSAMAYGDDE
jgi:hypothetical protein